MFIRAYAEKDEKQVIELWNECGLTRSWNNPQLDIQRKQKVQSEWFFVGEENGAVIATAMFGYDGHRGWVNYLAVSPNQQRKGYARKLMEHGETVLKSVGCPKINLQIRTTNTQVQAFYRSIGYTEDKVVSFGKRLIKDD
jgi:ribosomal protein S18 acetylase RimI-like enzyme